MKTLILSLVIFTGCSSSYQLSMAPGEEGVSFEEIQKAVEGEYTIITMKDSVIHGMIHQLRQDSIIYEEWNTAEVRWKPPLHSIPFSQVSRIQYKDRLKGLSEWGEVGVLTGTVIMTAIWAGYPNANPVGVVMIGLIAGTVIGGPAGAIAGFFIGHTYEYRLWKNSESKQKE
jgi:hypothetical protein